MSEFYDEMAGIADELIGEFQQGTVVLRRSSGTATDPNRPWDKTFSHTDTEVIAVVRPVHSQFMVGTKIVDRSVLTILPGPTLPEPLISDQVVIDGRTRTTYKFERIPEAGTPVAFKFWVSD